MNKKKLQSEQTKKKLADAARMLFSTKGYKGTSIEDIVAATGSSKGNIYYHFQSKEGLFQYLLEEWDREWIEQWAAKEHQFTTLKEKMYGLAEQMVVNDLNHPLTRATDEFMSSEWERSDVQENAAKFIASHIEFNRKMLQEAMDKGELAEDNVQMLAVVLESLLIGLAETSKRSASGETLELYRKALDVFLDGTVKRL
ncbi:TetR/AcrR family transcriptional regulator [Paenibacillus pinihumi]|uniref:TetR/AcrR family transcriptional regulator n=1 Tax=Paenibacillus pinihumi TaxID=669462 RepID=UPI00048D932C|nr:TetR/AcrR family transcriptional regulator [Paenibacillus pinihumi]